jgi:hypothetical protein
MQPSRSSTQPNCLLRLARAPGRMLMLLMLSLFEVLGLPRVRALNSETLQPRRKQANKP